MINFKMKADTKLTVVMWSRKFDYKTTAPSSGHFRRRRSTRELPVYLARHVCCSNFDAHPRRQSPPAAKHLTMFIVFPPIEAQSGGHYAMNTSGQQSVDNSGKQSVDICGHY